MSSPWILYLKSRTVCDRNRDFGDSYLEASDLNCLAYYVFVRDVGHSEEDCTTIAQAYTQCR